VFDTTTGAANTGNAVKREFSVAIDLVADPKRRIQVNIPRYNAD
jgi:hypothetical protein